MAIARIYVSIHDFSKVSLSMMKCSIRSHLVNCLESVKDTHYTYNAENSHTASIETFCNRLKKTVHTANKKPPLVISLSENCARF